MKDAPKEVRRYTEEGVVRFIKPKNAYHWSKYHGWQVWVNHAWRDADLVTNRGSHFLFCYWMPNGNHYYTDVEIDRQGYFANRKQAVSAKNPPRQWALYIDTMEEAM